MVNLELYRVFYTVAKCGSLTKAAEELYISQIAAFRTFTFMEIFYEAVSAFGTVGLSLNVTAELTVIGKIIISMLMIIGRLGPITISIALFKRNNREKNENIVTYPKGNV